MFLSFLLCFSVTKFMRSCSVNFCSKAYSQTASFIFFISSGLKAPFFESLFLLSFHFLVEFSKFSSDIFSCFSFFSFEIFSFFSCFSFGIFSCFSFRIFACFSFETFSSFFFETFSSFFSFGTFASFFCFSFEILFFELSTFLFSDK